MAVASEIVAEVVLSDVEHVPSFLQHEGQNNQQHAVQVLRKMLVLEDFSSFPDEQTAWLEHIMSMYQVRRHPTLPSTRPSNYGPCVRYPIFNMFRDSKITTIIQGTWPALFIALYSIWEVITRCYLHAIKVMAVPVKISEQRGEDNMESQRFWWLDMRVRAHSDEHLTVTVISVAGLCVWSLGLPFSIYLMCRVRCHKLQEFNTRRLLGFFYVGLEPAYYWWGMQNLLHTWDLLEFA